MAKFCGKCGHKLDENTGLCPNCDREKITSIEPTPDKLEQADSNKPNELQHKEKLTRKQKREKKKAEKKAEKARIKASRTFGQKVKRFFVKLVVIILVLAILFGAGLGTLVYYGIVDVPVVSDIMGAVGIECHTQNIDWDIPETNTADFSFYPPSKENIVRDDKSGVAYINNEVLVTLESKNYKDELEEFLSTIGGSIVGEIPEMAEYQILLNKEYTYDKLNKYMEEMERFDWVVSASLNYAIEIDTSYIPNDKKWKSEWSSFPEGTNWGVEAIDADEAWDYRGEMDRINVGVIDSMFDVNHEDLFFAEIPLGTYKISEVVSNGDRDWSDHGTHTAGTIAALFDNKKGISGVSTGSNLYGVSIWGLGELGYSSLQAWKISFYYLIAVNNCKVINVSMSADQITFEASRNGKTATAELEAFADELGKCLRSLIDLNYKFVVCKAAGNQNEVGGGYRYFKKDSDDTGTSYEYYSYSDYLKYLKGENDDECFERYQDRHEEIKGRLESGNVDAKFDLMGAISDTEVKERIIVVGSVKNLGTHKEGSFLGFGGTTVHDGYAIAASSQCGERVDILAPGVDINSTVKQGYQEMSGTSMAAPHVSGVAALVFSINPKFDGKKVKKIICESAVGEYGSEQYGILNAKNAVESALNSDNTNNVINVQPSVPERTTSDERDIVLVLDASGSMAGEPMEETKDAATKFVQTILKEDASISIVTYDDEAFMTSDFSTNESHLVDTIDDIDDGGSTNIEAGLRTADQMLSSSNAKKKIIVLMSDGEPNYGLQGEELITYSDELKEKGIYIYTLGFFNEITNKSSAQYLMEGIASEGCHYEVSDAESLVFFFGDIADQINGQKYIYVRIACPVDVRVSYEGEALDSSESGLNTRTNFGTLTFEDTAGYESYSDYDGESVDSTVKILRLKEGVPYDINIQGTGRGRMNYSIGFMDENGEYSDFRRFSNIRINDRTSIDTVAEVSDSTMLKVDEDGDGKYDIRYKAKANEYGKEVNYTFIVYTVLSLVAALVLLVFILVIYKKVKNRNRRKYNG